MTRSWAASAASWPFHSLLFAAYPVLFLFSQNIAEQLSLEPLLFPLVLAVAGAAVLLVVLRVVFRDWRRAAIACSVAVALFFAYGHVWNAVADTFHLHRYLLAVWAAIVVAGVILAWRLPRRALPPATLALNVASGVLVALNLVPIVGFQLNGITAPVSAREAPAASAAVTGRRPDIYYLIFDRYAGAQTLERVYGFDNSGFLDELERRGFYVARDSTANYLKTALSLASSLDMDYLDLPALEAQADSEEDWKPIYRKLTSAEAVQNFVKARGYTYVHLGSPFQFTATNSAADLTLRRTEESEFSRVLLDTTLVRAASVFFPEQAADPGMRWWLHTRYQFDRLEDLAHQPGPKFVFAHFILPHPPFVFDRDGNFLTKADQEARGRERGFREQVEYANRRILELLDVLLSGPEDQRPVVILQADEGPYPITSYEDAQNFQWPDATAAELEEKYRILNAYYLPGSDTSVLYPSITPVNSFRVVFNAYFDAGLPLLPDRSYVFVDGHHIYTAVDITDKAHGIEPAP
ncbi:MAG: hypothetical protein M3295_00765 [Chloroflexota bacterium]|nr:hypothetical protein [Chloroflexota bacterium]